MTILINFFTVVAWVVGVPCLLAVLLCLACRAWIHETSGEKYRTEQTLIWYLKRGILPWAWLIARYFMGAGR